MKKGTMEDKSNLPGNIKTINKLLYICEVMVSNNKCWSKMVATIIENKQIVEQLTINYLHKEVHEQPPN